MDDSWEKALAWNIFLVEKECSQRIGPNYPWFKFVSLLENLKSYYEKEQAEMQKAKRKR